MSREIVPGLADAIENRRRELGMTPGEFALATGVSASGLAPLRKGERRNYQERLTRGVEEALHWTPGSVMKFVERGLRPTTWEQMLETTERALEMRAGKLDQSGGTEELRDYLEMYSAVSGWRKRLGIESTHHPLALPHIMLREKLAAGELDPENEDLTNADIAWALEQRERFLQANPVRPIPRADMPAIADRLFQLEQRVTALESERDAGRATNDQFATAAHSGEEPGDLPATTQVPRGGRAEQGPHIDDE